MRKPTFGLCENKEADQVRSDGEADQHLLFSLHGIVQLFYFLNQKF